MSQIKTVKERMDAAQRILDMDEILKLREQLAAMTKEKAELQEALKLAMYEALNVKCGS